MGCTQKAVDVLAVLEQVLQENTKHYQDDFKIDIAQLTEAAKNPERGTAFYWMSRESGTWCEPEREVFIRGSIAYNIWTYYADSPKQIRALRVDIAGIEGNTVWGTVTPLEYKTHVQRVIRSSVPCRGIHLKYTDGHEQNVEAGEKQWQNKSSIHGEITEYSFIPQDEHALKIAIAAERRLQNRRSSSPGKAKRPVRE